MTEQSWDGLREFMTPQQRANALPPKRIQQRRTGGWRMPLDAKSVARPSKWGNPYRVDTYKADYPDELGYDDLTRRGMAVSDFRGMLEGRWGEEFDYPLVQELRGFDLACFCPLPAVGEPDICHAAVLLELANQ